MARNKASLDSGNRRTYVSLFSSAGVGCYGFKLNNFECIATNELLLERLDVQRYNHKCKRESGYICGDITTAPIQKMLYDEIAWWRDNEGVKQVDVVFATPPCQGMSTAGLKKKDDPRNRLILNVIDAIDVLRPKFVIIENVPELLQTQIRIKGKWVLIDNYLHERLDPLYVFNKNNVVNAMFYNVPQSRERCVYLLARRDMNVTWEFPPPSKKVSTMRDAIGNLPSLDPDVIDLPEDERNRIFPNYNEKRKAGLLVSPWHYPPRHYWRHVIAMMHTPEGHSAWENKKY